MGRNNSSLAGTRMFWLLLLVFVFFVWGLWAAAVVTQNAVLDARLPLANGQRRSMSPAPVIPVFPLFVWGVAKLIDLVVDPWGTVIIGSLHVIFMVTLVVSIVRDWKRLP
jgi:hypothetical protein